MRKVRKTPLIFAAINGQYRIMAFLLRIGVNPDAPDFSKSTPMHYAAAHGWYHCVQLLLEAGAEPNVMNKYQVRTAHWLVIQPKELGTMSLQLTGSSLLKNDKRNTSKYV